MVISCLTTCSTQRTEFICCRRAEKPQTMVTFWLYKSKMQKLYRILRLITRFRQELHNPARADGLPSPPSSVRTPTTYLSTCSLGPSTHHWAPCWMCSCSTPQLEKHSQVIIPQWFWNLLFKPTSREVFLAAAVKMSSPDGVRVLKPTPWQQGLRSTLPIYVSEHPNFSVLPNSKELSDWTPSVQKPLLSHPSRTKKQYLLPMDEHSGVTQLASSPKG